MAAHKWIGEASCIGIKASQLLRAPECSGRVLAVVTNAAYVQLDNGEICWLANTRRASQAHTRAALCDLQFAALRSGTRWAGSEGTLLFEDGWALDLSRASVWQP